MTIQQKETNFDFDAALLDEVNDMLAEERGYEAGELLANAYDATPESNVSSGKSEKVNPVVYKEQTKAQTTTIKETVTIAKETVSQETKERPELILIDTSGILYKQYEGRKSASKKDPNRWPSWYAKAPQGDAVKHGADGVVNVDAIAGYIGFYKNQILGSFGADRVIHVLDSKTASASRKAIFPDYKKNRTEKATEYQWQDDVMGDILLSMKELVAYSDGNEADDVIGTLSRQWMKNTGGKVLIISFDKDMTQLVSSSNDENKPTVAQAIWTNGVWKIYDDDSTVFEKMGVLPIQVADFLALKGDAADGIPGANGVGDVKATDLLNTYGTIETILNHTDEIKGRLGENIKASASMLPLYKELTTIKQFLKEEEVVIVVPNKDNNPDAVDHWLNKMGAFPLNDERDYSLGSISPANAKKEEDAREALKEKEKKEKAEARLLKKAKP